MNVNAYESPCWRVSLENDPSSAETVCEAPSSFVHVTVVPTLISKVDGSKAKCEIFTSVPAPAGVAIGALVAGATVGALVAGTAVGVFVAGAVVGGTTTGAEVALLETPSLDEGVELAPQAERAREPTVKTTNKVLNFILSPVVCCGDGFVLALITGSKLGQDKKIK